MSKSSLKKAIRQRTAETVITPSERGPLPPAVDDYVPPTDEQLANFACVMAGGSTQGLDLILTRELLASNPGAKALWLLRHREVQRRARLL